MQIPQQSSIPGDVGDVKNGPLAKAGPALIAVYQDYQEYVQAGGEEPFSSKQATNIRIVGTSVGVDVRGSDLDDLVTTLNQLGMQIQATDPRTKTIEGLLPISQLPVAAQLVKITTITPIYKPRRGL